DVETELVIDGSVDRVVWTDHEECVAVGRRPDRSLGGDVAGSAGPILDEDLLAKPLRQPLTQQAADHILRAAGGKTDDQAHRPRRIGLRPCNSRDSRERGSARCQMEKISAGKFHLNLPSHHSITSSARASNVEGTSRPSVLAVLRLMISSYLVGACTGKSAGFSPLRMRST